MRSGLQLDSTNYGVTLAFRVAVSDYITNLVKKGVVRLANTE